MLHNVFIDVDTTFNLYKNQNDHYTVFKEQLHILKKECYIFPFKL